jgi:hypothetical protein
VGTPDRAPRRRDGGFPETGILTSINRRVNSVVARIGPWQSSVVRPVPASFIMSLKRVLKTILPENVYGALSVLKNGVPHNPFPSMIVAAEAEFFRKCAREIAPQGVTDQGDMSRVVGLFAERT